VQLQAERGSNHLEANAERHGDLDAYLAELERIVAAEPLDVDAWANLGNHHLETAWAAYRRRAVRAADNHRAAALAAYQTAVAVVEGSLPLGFNGLLSWGGPVTDRCTLAHGSRSSYATVGPSPSGIAPSTWSSRTPSSNMSVTQRINVNS
jgi:hypothetical protein